MTRLYTVCINLDHPDMDPSEWGGGLPEAIYEALAAIMYQIEVSKQVELVCTDRETGEHVVICKVIEHDAPVLKTTH